MPLTAYNRLSEEKKKRIIEGAIKEFSVHSLEHASINAIAQNAKMSRTSMYYYFEDIDDIFMTIMNEVMNDFRENYGLNTDKQVDIFEIYYLFFKYVTGFKNTNWEAFIKTMFSDMSIKLQKMITEPYIQYYLSNKEHIKNLEKLDYESREELLDILFALFSLVTASINYYFKNDIEFENIDYKFTRGLRLLRYGVIKEEYRKEELSNFYG
jgi:AcrR family transcriptional regulator